MTKAELNYAKNLGEQVAKGDVLYCPLCKEKPTLDYSKEDQDLRCFGGDEDVLFCPHCDTTIDLVVNLGKNKGKWADFVLNQSSD